MIVTMTSSLALADDLTFVMDSEVFGPYVGADHPYDEVTCPRGTTPIGGGGSNNNTQPVYHLEGLRSTPTGFRVDWHRVPGTPSPVVIDEVDLPHGINTKVEAVCAAQADCVHRRSAALRASVGTWKSLRLECPAGEFAIGGGFTVTGDPTGIEVWETAPTGLFAPTGWRVSARAFRRDTAAWGLEAEVRCVPADVFEAVTVVHDPDATENCWSTVGPFAGYSYPFAAMCSPWIEGPSVAGRYLGAGTRIAEAVGGVESLGNPVGYSGTSWNVANAAYGPSGGPIDATSVAMRVDPEEFAGALARCASGGEPPQVDPWRFSIGADVWFGLLGGGDGVIWLPGSGPIPVDPEPWRAVLASLPVAVASYGTEDELDARLDEITAGLDAERTGWRVVDTAAATLETSDVVLVVPRDEAAEVEWLSRNRERLAELDHPTLLFFAEDGRGHEALRGW